MSSSETVGPEMRARLRIDQLGVDAHAVLIALHRAFENIAHAQILAPIALASTGLSLKVMAVLRAMTEAAADAREIGGEVFGDAVGEIIFGRVVREICEGQHHDGEMQRLRRLHQAVAEHVPAASGDQKKKGGGSGEQGEGRASFGRRLRPDRLAAATLASRGATNSSE